MEAGMAEQTGIGSALGETWLRRVPSQWMQRLPEGWTNAGKSLQTLSYTDVNHKSRVPRRHRIVPADGAMGLNLAVLAALLPNVHFYASAIPTESEFGRRHWLSSLAAQSLTLLTTTKVGDTSLAPDREENVRFGLGSSSTSPQRHPLEGIVQTAEKLRQCGYDDTAEHFLNCWYESIEQSLTLRLICAIPPQDNGMESDANRRGEIGTETSL